MSRLACYPQTHTLTPSGDLRLPTFISDWIHDHEKRHGGQSRRETEQAMSWDWRQEKLLPVAPPGFNIEKELIKVQQMSIMEFYEQSKSGGDLDMKNRYKSVGNYESFGNYFWGLAAATRGFPEWLALRGAGGYQEFRTKNTEPGWGHFWDPPGSSFGDDPIDQYWIRSGYETYRFERKSPTFQFEYQPPIRLEVPTETHNGPVINGRY